MFFGGCFLLGSLLLQLGVCTPWGGGGGGGGLLALLRFSASSVFFIEGVPSVAFDAQCSPGPANSL